MLLDQFSVLVAIGFSSASLGLTFFMMWAIGRSETHLLVWSVALALIVIGVICFGTVVESYNSGLLFVSFLFLVGGFGLLHDGCARFCSGQTSWIATTVSVAASFILMAVASLSYGFGVLPLGISGWNWIGGVTIAGAVLLTCVPELLFGKYRQR